MSQAIIARGGCGSSSIEGVVDIPHGGTNATTATGAIANFKSAIVNLVYPVGSYYWSAQSTSPATLFGGTWTQITGRFVLAAGGGYAVGSTGGSSTHTLSAYEMPEHSHGYYHEGDGAMLVRTDLESENAVRWGMTTKQTDTAGAGEPHNNMPPYIVAYCWRRTA